MLSRWSSAAALVIACAVVGQAWAADVSPESEYAKRIKVYQTIQPQGDTPFGEQINLYTGGLSFQQTEITLEGTGPTISLVRSTASALADTKIDKPYAFGNWVLSIPRIETLADKTKGWFVVDVATEDQYKRCSHFDRPWYPTEIEKGWYGIELVDGTGSRQQLLKRNAGNTLQPAMTDSNGAAMTFPVVTQQNWQLSCLDQTSNNAAGEAFLAIDPTGTKYYFDYLIYDDADAITEWDMGTLIRQRRSLATLFVSKIVDRFGNTVTYNYGGDDTLDSIVASDGREVAITWRTDARVIDHITVQPSSPQARTWCYEYSGLSASGGALAAVVQPDLSRWTFDLHGVGAGGEPSNLLSKCTTRTLPNGSTTFVSTVTSPSGLTGVFTASAMWHARSYVPSGCVTDPNQDPHEDNPPLFGTTSLARKEISGPGIPLQAWTYTFAPAVGSTTSDACAQTASCVDTKWVDVLNPSGDRTRYTYSNRWGPTESKLMKVESFQGTGGTPLRTQINAYAAYNRGPWPASLGYGLTDARTNASKDTTWTPQIEATTLQQDRQFSWTASLFDVYAKPTRVSKFSDINVAYTRTDDIAYENNVAKWVLGQVKSSTNVDTGLVESKTTYDLVTSLPWQTFAFDKLQQTLTYSPVDGTLASVSSGRDASNFNTTVTLSGWKRGIPQFITFPDTKTKSAVVNDFGLIDSVIDETGAKTCYQYDAAGRMARITYPSESTSQPGVCADYGASTNPSGWNPTILTFAAVGSAEYGVAAGHWKQTVSTGYGTKVTYFDAMWRPVVAESFDATNGTTTANTRSVSVTRYDSDGHAVYQSYPVGALVDYTTSNQGTRTAYDALGRAIRVDQDSELGVLSTTNEFLSGFLTRTTNPRGKQTTTQFLALDQPATEQPTMITAPGGVVTEIERNLFGSPTMLKRRSADGLEHLERYYVYDAAMRLCKTIEPETGATVMDYDADGNVAYSAAGLAGLSSRDGAVCASSDRSTALSSGRAVQRSYDARGRLSTMTFPDHRGDQTWTYTDDSLPAQIVTDGGDGIAVNAYHYNARRMLNGQGETIEQQGWYTWGFGSGYTPNGHVATHVYPGGETVSYAPNALGQPTQVSSSVANYASGIKYFPNGALQQFTYGNGLVHDLVQNTRQLPERSTDSYGGVAVLDDSYDYDGNGNVAGISDGLPGARGNRTMGYDDLDRLSWVVSPMFGSTANYWYDALDNLTHVSIGGTKARDQYYCYDTNWRLTNIKTGSCAGASVTGLGYDAQGNLQNKNGRTFNFDYGNRLRYIVDAGATLEAYRYDGHGRRILQWHPSGNILSMYGQDGVLRYQENGRTGKLTNYMYLSGSLVATHDQAIATGVHTVQYDHTDALGSPVAVTDATRNVVELSEYEPYGQLLNRPLKDGPGYTGHVSDAMSGLSYMQQRYYDPGVGRFLSVDPVSADSETGANFSRYSYANNSSYSFIDPDGMATYRLVPVPNHGRANTVVTDGHGGLRLYLGDIQGGGSIVVEGIRRHETTHMQDFHGDCDQTCGIIDNAPAGQAIALDDEEAGPAEARAVDVENAYLGAEVRRARNRSQADEVKARIRTEEQYKAAKLAAAEAAKRKREEEEAKARARAEAERARSGKSQ